MTAPKLCAKSFSGPHHFLGGRFVPPSVAEKYKLELPSYPGTSMCVRIGKPPKVDISAMRVNYVSPELLEDQVESDPVLQVFNEQKLILLPTHLVIPLFHFCSIFMPFKLLVLLDYSLAGCLVIVLSYEI